MTTGLLSFRSASTTCNPPPEQWHRSSSPTRAERADLGYISDQLCTMLSEDMPHPSKDLWSPAACAVKNTGSGQLNVRLERGGAQA